MRATIGFFAYVYIAPIISAGADSIYCNLKEKIERKEGKRITNPVFLSGHCDTSETIARIKEANADEDSAFLRSFSGLSMTTLSSNRSPGSAFAAQTLSAPVHCMGGYRELGGYTHADKYHPLYIY